jgi:hypothetical protein
VVDLPPQDLSRKEDGVAVNGHSARVQQQPLALMQRHLQGHVEKEMAGQSLSGGGGRLDHDLPPLPYQEGPRLRPPVARSSPDKRYPRRTNP